jgi:uncharacterized protein (TIGR02145 family)
VSAVVTPANFTNPLSWTVANSNIATIAPVSGGKDCKVTGIVAGTTTLTATVDGKTATCTLTVLAPRITLSNKAILVGETFTVEAEVAPSTLTISPTWSIANSSIATIAPISGSKQCKVTGIATGTTRLTITTNGITANCDIKVVTGGVRINGVIWATRNVDAPGTFAATPESAGKLYQWNRKVGWAATGTVTGWNSTNPTGTEWTAANDPSPAGWSVPTEAQIETLLASRDVWTTQSGVKGFLFTDRTTGQTIFLPAASERNGSDGSLRPSVVLGQYTDGGGTHNVTTSPYGTYWSSTQYDTTSASSFYVHGNSNYFLRTRNIEKNNACSVRSVVND